MSCVKLFIDVDNTIMNTAEIFIDKYCEDNNINKTIDNLKDWKFKSIDRKIDIREFLKYIETEDFFEQVQIDEDFLKFYFTYQLNYEWIFITKGTPENLKLKRKFIMESLPTLQNVKFIGIDNDGFKNIYNMNNSIQIDDCYEELNTNARFKILIKNNLETDYNRIIAPSDNVYAMNNWKEISESINWFRDEILENVKI